MHRRRGSARVRSWHWIGVAGATVTLAVGMIGASASMAVSVADHNHPHVTKGFVRSHLLSLTNLPTGWTVDNTTSSGSGLVGSNCLHALKRYNGQHRRIVQLAASFDKNSNLPLLGELLAAGPRVKGAYRILSDALAGCKKIVLNSNGKTLSGTIGRMSFPKVVQTSVAYSLGFTLTKVHVGFDVVVFRTREFVGLVGYADVGSPTLTTAEKFVDEAVAKAEGKHGAGFVG